MNPLQIVITWLMTLMMTSAQPGRKIYYPEGQETVAEATARYESIAQDITEVVYSPETKPLFQGPQGRGRTAAVVLAVMFHESSFNKHVDYGLGKYSRGDAGQSWCMMQLRVGKGRTMKWNTALNRPALPQDDPSLIFAGYTGEDLVTDRKLCIQEGLKVLHLSFGGTQGLPLQDRLRVYASGSRDKGSQASHTRMNLAIRWFFHYPQGVQDDDVMAALLSHHNELPTNG